MILKLTLAILLASLVGCSSAPQSNKKSQYRDTAIRTLLDGTWIVRQTKYTPIRKGLLRSKYYEYYSGLHAQSIGCKSYSKVDIKVKENEKAYKCVINGTYQTRNSVAIGTPWE